MHWRSVPLEWYAPIDGSKACSTNGPSVATGDPQQLLNHPANIRCAWRQHCLQPWHHVILFLVSEMHMLDKLLSGADGVLKMRQGDVSFYVISSQFGSEVQGHCTCRSSAAR